MVRKVEIDSDALLTVAQTLAQAANALNSLVSMQHVVKKDTIKPKRGRPKKNVSPNLNDNIEIINVDDSLLNDDNPDKIIQHKPLSPHIIRAKRVTNSGVDTFQTTVEVKKKPGDMKFLDIQNVGDRIPAEKYPIPTERRNPAQKLPFKCDRCRCDFEMYPSEIPQAFIKEKLSTGGEDKPRVYCNDCSGIGK